VGTTLEHCYKTGSGQRDFMRIWMTQDLSGDSQEVPFLQVVVVTGFQPNRFIVIHMKQDLR
jgi:hypothetical protein